MRQFTEDTLTDAVLARLKDASNPRFKQIVASAVKHLHGFARDVLLTEEEWFEGIKFLTAVGQKCDDKRQEYILLSDIDRKSTRLNSSHGYISYAVFCLKKKKRGPDARPSARAQTRRS